MTEINEQLRAHVTRVGFDLSLGKTHISRLVAIDAELKRNLSTQELLGNYTTPREPRAFNRFVTGTTGLVERGLVEHIMDARRRPGEPVSAMKPRRIWRITPAGRLVINLLKEAGIYQEYAAMVPVPVLKLVSA
jgi:hypothetical protein